MKYVAAFASSAGLATFRLPEFLSAAATLNIPITVRDDDIEWISGSGSDGGDTSWFSVFESSASVAELKDLAERCVLLRGVYILFETAPTLEDLYACLEERHGGSSDSGDTKASPAAAVPCRAFVGEDEASHLTSSTYSYQVETIGKKYSEVAKRDVLEAVSQRVPCAGDVDWRHPDRRYYIFLQHAVEDAPAGTKEWKPNGPLLRVFHCCLAVESRRCDLLARYDLRTRPYIGTTSMPPEESLMMANLCGVRRGVYAYDPFCGTGSLLVAAAHYGARTLGSDADGRAMRSGTEKGKTSPQMQQQRRLALAAYSDEKLHALTEEERTCPNMITNFKLYGLPSPERVRSNFSAWPQAWHPHTPSHNGDVIDGAAPHRPPIGIFDCILTDPPYGLREPRKKVGPAMTSTTTAEPHTPLPTRTLSAYSTDDVVLDLILFAATHLVVGGHLAFWHPTTDHFTDAELPTHPSLRVVCNIAQRVSLKFVRRLVVLEKVSPLPHPPPSRASCAAQKRADDLRVLMDATELPDNADYMHYRAKRERKRQAASLYRAAAAAAAAAESHGVEETPDGVARSGGNRRGHKHSRLDAQGQIVLNRQHNIELREAKRLASHLANASTRKRTYVSLKDCPVDDAVGRKAEEEAEEGGGKTKKCE